MACWWRTIEVAVGEVVFGGEGVGRVDPDAGEEGCGAESRDEPTIGGGGDARLLTQRSRISGYIGRR